MFYESAEKGKVLKTGMDDNYQNGWKAGYSFACEARKNSIGAGSACFLVKDDSLCSKTAPFLTWLQEEGFHQAYLNIGSDPDITWFYINVNSKLYSRGKHGVAITQIIADHAITIDEFVTIYRIYKKYEGKHPLEF